MSKYVELILSINGTFQKLVSLQQGIVGSAGLLMFGTLFSQLIVILSSPILTRIYTPHEFGLLAVYVSIFAFITIIASLRYELAIPLSRSVTTTLAIVKLSVWIVFAVILLVFVLVLVGSQLWVTDSSVGELGDYFWLIPLGALIAGLHKVFSFWALKKKQFIVMAVSRMLQGGGMVSAQIIFGIFGMGFVGLIWGHIIGFAAGLAALLWFSVRLQCRSVRKVRLKSLRRVAWRYRKFPKYSVWSDMFNVLGTQSPPILIASLFSVQSAGFYLLANRVANAPVALIAEAIGKAFMAESVSHRGSETLPVLCLDVYRLLVKLSLGPMVVITIIAPELFYVIFGEQWGEAGFYLQLLMPSILLVFLVVPIMMLYVVLEQQQAELRFQIALVIFRLVGFGIGAMLAGIVGAIFLYSILGAATYGVCGIWIMRKAGVTGYQIIIVTAKEVVFVFALSVPLLLLMKIPVQGELGQISLQMISIISLSSVLVALFLLRARPYLAKLNRAGK